MRCNSWRGSEQRLRGFGGAQRRDDWMLINIHGAGVKRALKPFQEARTPSLSDLKSKKREASDLVS